MTHKKSNPTALADGFYVVANRTQIDTRRSERVRAARPAGPFNGLDMRGGQDLRTAGDPISADDVEGGEAELAQLIALGMVVRQRGSTPPEAA
jgi:hypothetical protein